jgi:hypothetical protein
MLYSNWRKMSIAFLKKEAKDVRPSGFEIE